MPDKEMKGITVRIDAALHAEIKAYLESHEMTMGEFVALAAENELHPKFKAKEEKSMENMRTLAFQVPEDLFQRIKEYLKRNGMTQKQFVLGLIEDELERDEAMHQDRSEEDSAEEDETQDDFQDKDVDVSPEEFEDEPEEESENEDEAQENEPEM